MRILFLLFFFISIPNWLLAQPAKQRIASLTAPDKYCYNVKLIDQWASDSIQYATLAPNELKADYPRILWLLAEQYIHLGIRERESFCLARASEQCRQLGITNDTLYWHIQITQSLSDIAPTNILAITDSIEHKFGTNTHLWRRAQYFQGLHAYLKRDYSLCEEKFQHILKGPRQYPRQQELVNLANSILVKIKAKRGANEVARLMMDSLVNAQFALNIPCDPLLFSFRTEYSSRLIGQELPQIAKRQLALAEQEIQQENRQYHFLVGRLDLVKAQLANDQRRPLEAIQYYLSAEQAFNNLPPQLNQNNTLLALYNGLGSLYRKQANWSKADAAYQAAVEVIEPKAGEAIPINLIAILVNQAGMQSDAGYYQKSINTNRRARRLVTQKLGSNHYYQAVINNNMAEAFLEYGLLDSASIYFESSLLLRQQLYAPNHPRMIVAHSGMASLAAKKKNWLSAINAQKRSIEICSEAYSPTDGRCYKHRISLAQYLLANQSLDQAQSVLESIVIDFPIGSPKDIPILRLEHGVLKAQLFFAQAQAQVSSKKQLSLLDSVCYFVSQNTNLLDSLQSGFDDEVARSALLNHNLPLYETGIEAAVARYDALGCEEDLQFAWQCVSRLKYNLQWQKRRELSARYQKELIPVAATDSLITLERLLQKDALGREERLAIIRQHEQFQEYLSRRYPAYRRSRYSSKTIDWANWQLWSTEQQTAIVGYHLSRKNVLYAFRLSDGNYSMQKSQLNANSLEALEQLTETAGNFDHTSTNLNSLLETAIIDPLSPSGSSLKKVLIIPAAQLAKLSFASIPIQEQGTFLGDRLTISYGWSMFDIVVDTGPQIVDNVHFWANASVDYNKELNALKQLTKVESENKTDQQSLQLAERDLSTSLLHFSTHALVTSAGDALPYLSLSNTPTVAGQQINIEDISSRFFPVPLVSLSACKTGSGQLKPNEGIESIADAFSRAGAKSILMTLWEVPDNATSQIVSSFYNYLGQGLDKASALQKAQIDFRQQAMSKEQLHPAYWAGFVVVGNTSPLTFKSSIDWKWILIGGPLLLALFLFARRRL